MVITPFPPDFYSVFIVWYFSYDCLNLYLVDERYCIFASSLHFNC